MQLTCVLPTQGRASYSMEFAEYADVPKNIADAIIAEHG